MALLKDTVVAGNLNVSNRIVGHEVRANCLECFPATSGYGGYIDFHYDGSAADYTSRIIENANGNISINSVNFINSLIRRTGLSKSWVDGRDGAIVRMTSISGYSPCISVKTTNGTWEMGAYDYSTHTDRLIFTYITDGNYNSNNNAITGQVQFLGGGHVVANYYYGNGSQLTGLNGSNISSGTVAAARLPQVQRVLAWKSSNFAASYTGSLSWNGPNITIPIFALITVRLDANDANIGYTQVLLPYCGTSSGYYWFGYNGNSGFQYTGGVDASGTHGGKLYHRSYQRMAINQTANNYCDLTFEGLGYVGSTSNSRYCTPVLIELFGF